MPDARSRRTYLPGVEGAPQPGPYRDLIAASEASGREPWGIWDLFAYRARMAGLLAAFTQETMREPAELSAGLRELLAAYVSMLNRCDFCRSAHAAVAAELLGNEELVASVLRDPEGSPLGEKEKALLRYAAKVTVRLPETSAEDVETLRKAGWGDEAIYYAITACALFNFYNRWVTASGVRPASEAATRTLGKLLAEKGYDPARRLARLRETQGPP